MLNDESKLLVELMKVIQREYKLGSYKLDNVAAHFIKDTILDISFPEDNKIKIKTKNTYGLGLDQYIVFLYNDGIIEEKCTRQHHKKWSERIQNAG
jgi:hypothetical protein